MKNKHNKELNEKKENKFQKQWKRNTLENRKRDEEIKRDVGIKGDEWEKLKNERKENREKEKIK